LSAEERALLAFVSTAAPQALAFLQEDEPSVGVEPIQIAVIQIEPLQDGVLP
jgi:hypothetical protein